jgi:hypothetical protein
MMAGPSPDAIPQSTDTPKAANHTHVSIETVTSNGIALNTPSVGIAAVSTRSITEPTASPHAPLTTARMIFLRTSVE